ncbi:signal peptide peptidase-like protein 2 [Tanacetum coccineum]
MSQLSANEELYPGCDYVTRLDFMAKFTYFKVKGKLTDSIFNEMLEFFQHVFPTMKGYKLPPSYYAIKKTFKMIGLGYELIHACVNDCFLFWGDNNKDVHFCPVCKTSRLKDSNTPRKEVPKKVLRYFPIIPRLQRLYKSSHTAKEMTWHATRKCTEPDKMQHPVDGRAWKNFDTKYSNFAKEPRNVRLGLVADGVETIDVVIGQKFNMRAMVLWTINNFPTRSSLSGWSGQEDGYPPRKFDQDQIQAQLARLPMRVKGKHPSYGGVKIKHNVHMFSFERFMKKLKGYVRNKAKPEGSIAEGYVAEEVFRSLCKSIGLWSIIRFDAQELNKVTWYVLHNSPEIDTYRSQFKSKFPNKDMKEEFPDWFGSQVNLDLFCVLNCKNNDIIFCVLYLILSSSWIRQCHINNDPGVSATSELFALSGGPTPTPISVNSYVVNGVRFVVHSRDECRTTQNSGICSPFGRDGEIYYGQLQEIIEFSYLSFKVVLFRVKWFNTSNEGRKVKHLVIRNNMTQILTKGEAFKDDQYILATQVKQCFYLEDMARRQPHWMVVKHVNHKKFLDGGVIVVEKDPDVILFDKSSDLPLSISLNDLDNATLHIDGQSTEVDTPPDIIDLDEDDDIIDNEDALPHDLADSDDEDLVNVDDDDGVDVMSADVARGHGDDDGGDDRPPTNHIPIGCGGYFVNRGKVETDIQEQDKNTAKNNQSQVWNGKDKVKSKSIVNQVKEIQLKGLKLPNLKLYYKS